MNVLVVGATGATGRLLVSQLLNRGCHVKAVVRSAERLPETVRAHAHLTLIEVDILALSETELAELVSDCRAVASCLGHSLTWKGLFGQPRRLVTDAVQRLCEAVQTNHKTKSTRFVLMNTSGNRNRDLDEPISFAETLVVGLIRLLLPPHSDNEHAADYLRTQVGQNHPAIEWAAVRPDSLVDRSGVTDYEIHPSPTRSAIFNAGETSRINVADLMARLITEEDLWEQWKGQMPVIYNQI
ncbi:MAG: NAD(P)-dependent oxidoreductase [Hydrogenovibrio sp.]